MKKNSLTEDTVIEIGKSISLSAFRAFFIEATGKELPSNEFQPWLNMQAGKTLKEAMSVYGEAMKRKNMSEILLEDRFSIVSDSDKAFINAFDDGIRHLGYGFGGGIGDGYVWGKYMIIYSKAGVKSKNVIARIFIRESAVVLRLFFNNIDKHRSYIESAPAHIKDVFTGKHGICNCAPKKENCRMRKIYTIDNKLIEKCSGVVFEFHDPAVDKVQDYMNLLSQFYPAKVSHSV